MMGIHFKLNQGCMGTLKGAIFICNWL